MCAASNQRKTEPTFEWTDNPSADPQTVFEALEDETCRTILEVVSDRALTASELSEECDIPTSTTYRKIDMLTEAGLIEESLRLRKDGRHAAEYTRSFDDLRISVCEIGGVEVDISQPTEVLQASD